jgi:hypothetical protein
VYALNTHEKRGEFKRFSINTSYLFINLQQINQMEIKTPMVIALRGKAFLQIYACA